MDWRRIDLNLLKVLAVMLEERSVARCADRLFISPSAVSHALGRLRKALSDPLFVVEDHRQKQRPTGKIAGYSVSELGKFVVQYIEPVASP